MITYTDKNLYLKKIYLKFNLNQFDKSKLMKIYKI